MSSRPSRPRRSRPSRLVAAATVLASLLAGDSRADDPPPEREAIAAAFRRGDYSGARVLAEARLRVLPAEVATEVLLARSLAAQGQLEASWAALERARKHGPRDPDVLYYLSLTSGVLAQAEYDRLFSLAPDSARAHQLRGESLRAQGLDDEAAISLAKALEKNPRSIELLVAVADLDRKRLRYAEALLAYERAEALAPGRFEVLYGMGVCRAFRGQPREAASLFREALRRQPGSAAAHLGLGIALLQLREPDGAAEALEAAVAAEPGMRQGHYQLGRAYQALGRTDDAAAAFARAQQILEQERLREGPAVEPKLR